MRDCSQFDQAPDLWREVLDKLDEAIADRIPIVAQVHGRTVGLLMCLEGSYHPLMYHPAYGEIRDLPLAERCAALRAGPVRERLIHETPDDDGFFEQVVLGTMYRHTLCAGVETVRDDEFTGELPGRLIRGPR